jgi:hypothetical protein
MAKMERMPDRATIRAGRGKVDFYLWKGVPCCRSWPRWKPRAFTAGESASQLRFSAAAKEGAMIDAGVREMWLGLAVQGKGEGWVDAFRAAALGKGWVS